MWSLSQNISLCCTHLLFVMMWADIMPVLSASDDPESSNQDDINGCMSGAADGNSGNLIFLDLVWPVVTETMESKSMDKKRLL